jgi:hydrogenase maturation protein HypF
MDEFIVENHTANGFSQFEIIHSQEVEGAFQPISPDVSICDECLCELNDPSDRRYLYPFINCTNCGPRFTIIQDIPYDRPKTTMSGFELCAECASEYTNPLDRRFHAQPVACAHCGPSIWLESCVLNVNDLIQPVINPALPLEASQLSTFRTIRQTQQLLEDGFIVAIKGLGGFHLACDAQNVQAVTRLRNRKLRVDKPFALMMPDIQTVEAHCFVDPAERDLLISRQRPIVILQRRPESPIAREIAPGQNTIGVMLPYTPLHYLLFKDFLELGVEVKSIQTLVMTSGNISEEPIAKENDDAKERLRDLADVFLMHDRPIHMRCDDSVVRIPDQTKNVSIGDQSTKTHKLAIMPLRRSRGYAPFPIQLPYKIPPVLAVGAELKNTFCLARGNYAFLSHHIGDLENYETLRSFEESIEHFERLFRIQPEVIAYDLHPDYLATRYALQRAASQKVLSVRVQHHHAHIASCMVEHGLAGGEQVIGLSFDGTGFGLDGAIWGGEIFVADYKHAQRNFHLAYVALPGSDKAIREPWRMALSWLDHAGIEWNAQLPPVQFVHQAMPDSDRHLDILRRQIHSGLNAPKTSSMGRLFDAVAALVGVRQVVNYEAQAAIEFEALIDVHEEGAYPIYIPSLIEQSQDGEQNPLAIDPTPMLLAIVTDIQKQVPISAIAARFHNSLALMALEVCLLLREKFNISTIALSGGVWQNLTLLKKTIDHLEANQFQVLIHRQVPTNDGGISVGQAIIAAQSFS